MDIRKVKKLIEMLEESAIDEIEIHEDKDTVRVSRNMHAPCAGSRHHAGQGDTGRRAT